MISRELTNIELINEYLESKATLSPNTLKSYRNTLRRFSSDVGYPFTQIKEKHIANWVNQYNYKKTKKSFVSILRVFYNWLIKHDLVSSNPCSDIIIKNGLKKKQKYMDQDDFEKILSQCSGLRERTMIYFLWYTGVRAKEFRNIKLEDIEFANDIIHVRVSKTSNGQRKLDIHPNLKPILKEYVERSDGVREENEIKSQYLFLTKHGTKFHPRTLQYLISKLQQNLNMDYGCHDFRRAFVTNVYFATKDIVLAQEYAGHASIETTRGYIMNHPRMRNEQSRAFKAANF